MMIQTVMARKCVQAWAFTGLIFLASTAGATTISPGYHGMSGHFSVDPDASPDIRNDGWGVSFYSSVHPLKPGLDEWTQLGWGSWMSPNRYEDADGAWDPLPEDAELCSPDAAVPSHFQSIEGGVGTWADVPFPIQMPMYMLGATADCYNSMLGAPGYNTSGTQALPADQLYFAQLSNRLLLPPARLLFQPVSEPRLFGAGWLALPLVPPNMSPHGIPTGGNNWTLFFNTANFKGAVGFFTPAFWTALVNEPGNTGDSIGFGLDTRNSVSGRIGLEVGFTRSFSATDSHGTQYRRIPRLTFGADEEGKALLLQDYKRYFKSAAWEPVRSWIDGGAAPAAMNAAGIWNSTLGYSGFSVRMLDEPVALPVDLDAAMSLRTVDDDAGFALQWSAPFEAGVLPEYYRRQDNTWIPVSVDQVPAETALADQAFPTMPLTTVPSLDTGPGSPWVASGWVAGPYSVVLENETEVQYVWYRFVDQPALARLPLTEPAKAKLQAWAESLHQAGTNGLTIPPPSSGQLVLLDERQLVTAPPGLGQGYVPIAIAQRHVGIFQSGFE